MSDEPIRVDEVAWQRRWDEEAVFVAPNEVVVRLLLPRDVPVSIGKDAHGARPQLFHR